MPEHSGTHSRHLVAVWNPTYARNAMEEHLTVFLRHAAARHDGGADDEDVYVWWGRVHSRHRRTDLPHLGDIRAIDASLDADEPPETHLYLTDYQSLYVADLAEIHFGALPDEEADHVPGYYHAERLDCDFWFKLWDIRRLVANDMLSTIEELRHLLNVNYHDQPVSLYGGMVELPLVVTRPDGARFFDPDERDTVTDTATWAEFDAAMGPGLMSVERSLREDLLGETAWRALDPAVRNFVATGEKVFREHRSDPVFDFAPVIGSFSKAIEVQVGAVLRQAMPKLPRAMRLMNIDGQTVDLAERRALSLQQVVQALAGERGRRDAIAAAVEHGAWFTDIFPVVLEEFRKLRNEGTHEARVDRRAAALWRDQLLGVGCTGHLVELARVKPR